MSYFENYSNTLTNDEIKNSVRNTAESIFEKHLKTFDYKSVLNGLLLGEVQSGKTGQMLGAAAKGADEGFTLFIILTSDNIKLYEKTLERTLSSLDGHFCVCGENDIHRFNANKMQKPALIFLKKNTGVLKKWINSLNNSRLTKDRPLFIIDDEADAASLNTKVNQDDISKINEHIENIKKSAPSCIYLQVTATPQAVILQTLESGFRPSFIEYFYPGKNYLGGDFFFSNPEPYTVRRIDNDELKNLEDEDEIITEGLSSAILSFLISSSEINLRNKNQVCNMIIHPSVNIKDHGNIKNKISGFLNEISSCHDDETFKNNLCLNI